jgi:hypothetical protein
MVAAEKTIEAAARHVAMAQEQRELFRLKKEEAVWSRNKDQSERVMCYVADFAQNMYIPNFASEQPGATYYYSPMNAFVFGVVDASIQKLSAYIYTEDVGRKGGNNVASLLMLHLERTGIFNEAATKGPLKELNFVMDNCSGQNKNRHVLRLLHFLVKRKVATVVRAIFLIAGHTKNDCDRLFNTMKKDYRKSNCYTPQDLVACMTHQDVEPIEVTADAFYDWDKLEKAHVSEPTGEVKANHIFTVDMNVDNGNTMVFRISDKTGEPTSKVLVKKAFRNSNTQYWLNLKPTPIPPVGIQDIKWQTLHKQWGAFIPEEKKKEWRYYYEEPPEEIKKQIKDNSKEARATRQKRSRTVVTDGGEDKKVAAKPTKKKMEAKPTKKKMAKSKAATATTTKKRSRTVVADGGDDKKMAAKPTKKKMAAKPTKKKMAKSKAATATTRKRQSVVPEAAKRTKKKSKLLSGTI